MMMRSSGVSFVLSLRRVVIDRWCGSEVGEGGKKDGAGMADECMRMTLMRIISLWVSVKLDVHYRML